MPARLPRTIEDYDGLMDIFTQIRSNDFAPRDGLDYFYAILKLLGKPQESLGRVVHVTGTNGKGSVSWKVAKSIQESQDGVRIASYGSPNLYEFEERIAINGEPISKGDMVRYTNIILAKLYGHSADGQLNYNNFRIGMVGIIVCIAFLYIRDQRVDYTVVEGGIGIKMDHTTVVTPVVSVITFVIV